MLSYVAFKDARFDVGDELILFIAVRRSLTAQPLRQSTLARSSRADQLYASHRLIYISDFFAIGYVSGSSTAMINPVIYGAFHLRRPREARSQHSTVVLSSASFRQPAAFEAKQTIAQVNNVHPDGQFCVKHCIATPSSREKTRRRDRSCSPVQVRSHSHVQFEYMTFLAWESV